MVELVADARRDGWKGVLALLLTPAALTLGPIALVLNGAHKQDVPIPLHVLAGAVFVDTYPFLLGLGAASLLPALALLVFMRQLKLFRLMLLAALIGGVALALWMPISDSIWPPPKLSNASPTGRSMFHLVAGALYGFLNAGLFALVARPWRWAASLPRSPSS